jgi:hypothetical protein
MVGPLFNQPLGNLNGLKYFQIYNVENSFETYIKEHDNFDKNFEEFERENDANNALYELCEYKTRCRRNKRLTNEEAIRRIKDAQDEFNRTYPDEIHAAADNLRNTIFNQPFTLPDTLIVLDLHAAARFEHPFTSFPETLEIVSFNSNYSQDISGLPSYTNYGIMDDIDPSDYVQTENTTDDLNHNNISFADCISLDTPQNQQNYDDFIFDRILSTLLEHSRPINQPMSAAVVNVVQTPPQFTPHTGVPFGLGTTTIDTNQSFTDFDEELYG